MTYVEMVRSDDSAHSPVVAASEETEASHQSFHELLPSREEHAGTESLALRPV
jgi:hypothetical protein